MYADDTYVKMIFSDKVDNLPCVSIALIIFVKEIANTQVLWRKELEEQLLACSTENYKWIFK
jgi:hypothetical protein